MASNQKYRFLLVNAFSLSENAAYRMRAYTGRKEDMVLNHDLAAGSELAKANHAHKDFDVLRKSVLKHEQLHGVLVFEAMAEIQKQGNDPAKIIEALSVPASGATQLVDRADTAIGTVEALLGTQNHDKIKARLAENLQYNRPGEILVRDGSGGYESYTIANMAKAGDN